jgi:hypothetical protein
MNDLKTISGLVKHILEQNKQARNSDCILYLKVLEHQSHEKGIDLQLLSVPVFLTEMKQKGFVGFETVRRARQKVQATFPELSGSETVEGFRMENEKEFRAFAVGDL